MQTNGDTNLNLSALTKNRVTSVVLGSIQWKFVATVLAISVITIVALTVLNIMDAGSRSRATAETELASGAELHAGALESALGEFNGDLRMLLNTPPVAAIQRALANGGTDPNSGDSYDIWRGRLATIFTALILCIA